MSTFRVIVMGPVAGATVDDVAQRVAMIFGQPSARVAAMLRRPVAVVRRGVDLAMAERIHSALASAGCKCSVETEATGSPSPQVAPPASEPASKDCNPPSQESTHHSSIPGSCAFDPELGDRLGRELADIWACRHQSWEWINECLIAAVRVTNEVESHAAREHVLRQIYKTAELNGRALEFHKANIERLRKEVSEFSLSIAKHAWAMQLNRSTEALQRHGALETELLEIIDCKKQTTHPELAELDYEALGNELRESVARDNALQSKLATIWNTTDDNAWILQCFAVTMTTRMKQVQGSARARQQRQLERSEPLVAEMLRTRQVMVAVLERLKELDLLMNVSGGESELTVFRESCEKLADALTCIREALGRGGGNDRLEQDDRLDSDRHAPNHASSAEEFYRAAEAEVARQKSIWFGRTFAHARALFQEAAQRGNPQAASRLIGLPQR